MLEAGKIFISSSKILHPAFQVNKIQYRRQQEIKLGGKCSNNLQNSSSSSSAHNKCFVLINVFPKTNGGLEFQVFFRIQQHQFVKLRARKEYLFSNIIIIWSNLLLKKISKMRWKTFPSFPFQFSMELTVTAFIFHVNLI